MSQLALRHRLLRCYCTQLPILKGRATLAKRVFQSAPPNDESFVSSVNGYKIALNPSVWTDYCTYVMGGAEVFMKAFFRRNLKKHDVVLDIGAYIGNYGLSAATQRFCRFCTHF